MEAIVLTLMQIDAEQRQLSLFGTGHEAVPGSGSLFVLDAPVRARSTLRSRPHAAQGRSSAITIAAARAVHIGGHAHFG
jgi:hypothetical protein